MSKPDVIPKKTFKRKRNDNNEDSRALTTNELAELNDRAAERQQQQEDRDRQIIRQRALQDSEAGPQPELTRFSPPPAMSEPPPSTAPARLSRGGRTIKKTARKQAAQASGLLPESQDR